MYKSRLPPNCANMVPKSSPKCTQFVKKELWEVLVEVLGSQVAKVSPGGALGAHLGPKKIHLGPKKAALGPKMAKMSPNRVQNCPQESANRALDTIFADFR